MGDLQGVLGVEVCPVERVDRHPVGCLVGGAVRRDEAAVPVLPAARLHPDRAEGLVLLPGAGGAGGGGVRRLLGLRVGVHHRLGSGAGGGGGEKILGEGVGGQGPVQRHSVLLGHPGLSLWGQGH